MSPETTVELTPELLIRELLRGAALPRVLARYGAKQSLVKGWARDPQFKQRLDRALAERRRSSARTVEQRIPNLIDRFIAAYESLGSAASISGAVKALQEEGLEVSVGTIYSRLNSDSPQYDPVLYERFVEAQAARVAPIEDAYTDGITETGDLKLQREYLERHPATRRRYAKPPERFEVDVRQEQTRKIIAEHRQTVRLEFLQEAQERFGTIPEVIDVEADVSDERGDPARIGGEEADERGEQAGHGGGAEEEGRGEAEEEVA